MTGRGSDDPRYMNSTCRGLVAGTGDHSYPVGNTGVMTQNVEPSRKAPDKALSLRMSRLARRHTQPELALRRELHARGLRYRVQFRVPANRRRTIDIAFTRAVLAVFVDGCFWHGCPEHGVLPRTNTEWWTWKIARTVARDRETTRLLEESGWSVLRVWEHEAVMQAADKVTLARAAALRRRAPMTD